MDIYVIYENNIPVYSLIEQYDDNGPSQILIHYEQDDDNFPSSVLELTKYMHNKSITVLEDGGVGYEERRYDNLTQEEYFQMSTIYPNLDKMIFMYTALVNISYNPSTEEIEKIFGAPGRKLT